MQADRAAYLSLVRIQSFAANHVIYIIRRKPNMLIAPLLQHDLEQVSALTPEGWDDLTPHFNFNLNAPFCIPLKVVLDGQLAGLGNVICNRDTAWLAHIVVHPGFRNRGLGKAITAALLEHLDRKRYPSVMLDATDMGYPVYHSLGFETLSHHVHFSGDCLPAPLADPAVSLYTSEHRDAILQLDREATGEDRSEILQLHLHAAQLYREGDKVYGVYFPTLHRGLLIADPATPAWEALLRIRLSEKNHAMVPEGNTEVQHWLKEAGFRETRRSRRMCLGPQRSWKPEMIFNVSGGAMG